MRACAHVYLKGGIKLFGEAIRGKPLAASGAGSLTFAQSHFYAPLTSSIPFPNY